MCVGYGRWSTPSTSTSVADGSLHENELLTQRVVDLDGVERVDAADEVLYVLDGEGELAVAGEQHALRPGTAAFLAGGTVWRGSGVRALSVLVHDPPPASAAFAVSDLTAEEKGSATGGRQFVLGARPELGCASATQFIGLRPAGARARPFPPLRRGDLHPRGRG